MSSGTTSVSLSVFATNPTDGKLVAILQQRGPWDHEQQKSQSFAGCYQLAVHGKTETPREAVLREAHEELGLAFAELTAQTDVAVINGVAVTAAEQVLHFLTLVPFDWLSQIELHKSASRYVLITVDEVDDLQPINPKLHRSGVDPNGARFMFQDEINALREGFARLSS